jgi:hypothetical protein
VSTKPARRLGQHGGVEESTATGDDGASRPVDDSPRHAPSSKNDYVGAWQLKALVDPA